MRKSSIRVSLAILLICLFGQIAHAGTTTISGTVLDSAGNPFNGRWTFVLPVGVVDTVNHVAIAPTAITYSINNGTFPAYATLPDTATLSPANVYLTAYKYDSSGALLEISNYAPVTGSPWNVGLAVPVAVTTTNISFLTPASLTVLQTWTALQNFSSGITIGGGSTISKVLYNTTAVTFAAIGAGNCDERTFAVATAAAGAPVVASPSSNLGSVSNFSWSARVSTTGNVTIRVCNVTVGAATPAVANWSVAVFQ